MSLEVLGPTVARLAGSMALVAALAASASAQKLGTDRFFADRPVGEEEQQSTVYDGSFTSTTFYYREDGENGTPPSSIDAPQFSASPVDRIFTDLRTQLDAKHIGGSRGYFRADVRGRLNTTTFSTDSNPSDGTSETDVPYQSGTRYGNELDIRELYVRRDGASVDLSFGRQYSLELAATKFDGLKLEGQSSERWKYILFGGLYPSRISRDLRDDYPTGDGDVDMPGFQAGGSPILPITGGAGLAYRFKDAYGGFGAVGILPLAEDAATGETEKPRLFATANGYWRASQKVDVYHYLVADAAGADGASLTNLTFGMNLQPTSSLRAYANVTRIDTDTLNVTAQTKLQDPDSMPEGGPPNTAQNNLEVERIAQESARVGLSAAFGTRVEVSTSGGLRRRGELRLEPVNGDPADRDDDLVFAAAQAADITVGIVDRRSIGDMRIGVSGTSSFGVGNANLYRSKALIGRLDATKELADGRAEIETNLTYIGSDDDNRGTACNLATGVATCYGASSVKSITVGVLAFWRFSPSWFGLVSGVAGPQFSESASSTGAAQSQPTVITSNFLLRLAYRF